VAIISLQIKSKASEELSAIASKHIPFAVAKTLTQIAQQSQQEVRKNIREKFFIRKKSGGFESSIRIKPATKTKLTAEVYAMAAFAAMIEITTNIVKDRFDRQFIKNLDEVIK
jgi:hypothetical protein